MPGKSLFEVTRASAHNFYASVIRGEVSDANVRGYLRMSSQIEEIWATVELKVTESVAQGTPPWKAYQQVGKSLAFVRAARTYVVFVRELLAADAAADPSTSGFLPHITYDQATALALQIQPNLERAVVALNDLNYVPDISLPMELGPRIESQNGACPLPHLQGMIAAAREVREWTAGLLAQYELALSHVDMPTPAAISQHTTNLTARLALADVQLRAGVDLVGQISQGDATAVLHEQAEDSLWNALQGFFWLSQTIADPALVQVAQGRPKRVEAVRQSVYRDRRIHPNDLWEVADASARRDLRGTQFGNKEMLELCEKMRGILSAQAQQYADEVNAAYLEGKVYAVAAMANCPFEPLYRTRQECTLLGRRVPSNYEFHWNCDTPHGLKSSGFFHPSVVANRST